LAWLIQEAPHHAEAPTPYRPALEQFLSIENVPFHGNLLEDAKFGAIKVNSRHREMMTWLRVGVDRVLAVVVSFMSVAPSAHLFTLMSGVLLVTTKLRTRLSASKPDDITLDIRLGSGDVARVAVSRAQPAMLDEALPWRTFRMYYGQPHYSGTYWSATENGSVIYESRLELCRLILADFDAKVSHIVAQPFLMRAKVDGVRRRHIPDYFLNTSEGPVVVAVKPRDQLDKPKNIDTFAWVRGAIEAMGWRFEIASEPAPVLMENVRFLAGYRRSRYVSADALSELRNLNLHSESFGDVLRQVRHTPPPLARAALLHMLWDHEISTDLNSVLTDQSILRARSAS
jgi:TnsA endonuclease N terminal